MVRRSQFRRRQAFPSYWYELRLPRNAIFLIKKRLIKSVRWSAWLDERWFPVIKHGSTSKGYLCLRWDSRTWNGTDTWQSWFLQWCRYWHWSRHFYIHDRIASIRSSGNLRCWIRRRSSIRIREHDWRISDALLWFLQSSRQNLVWIPCFKWKSLVKSWSFKIRSWTRTTHRKLPCWRSKIEWKYVFSNKHWIRTPPIELRCYYSFTTNTYL